MYVPGDVSRSTTPESSPSARQTSMARLGLIAAWVWAVLAGGGGLVLLLMPGPLLLTNGWFALFSGVAAWPLTASASQKFLRVKLSGRTRIAAAALLFVAGRIALLVGNQVPWLSR